MSFFVGVYFWITVLNNDQLRSSCQQTDYLQHHVEFILYALSLLAREVIASNYLHSIEHQVYNLYLYNKSSGIWQ